MIAFHIGLNQGGPLLASTMAFATLCLSRLVHGFNSKSKKHVVSKELFSNKYLWAAFGVGFVLLNIVLLVPAFEGLFQVAPLTLNNLLTIYGLSLCTFIVVQFVKFIREKFTENKTNTVQESNKENRAA